ncbi:MAG TPA: hypothetical protein VK860_00445 [Ilumatobacteraceae bacterium]|nr:hypothetical protein [Ilumatobacteraceae bacterium]
MSGATPAHPSTNTGHVVEPGVPPAHLSVVPWIDPVVDEAGFDPRSRYVEMFWLGILGPTATWLIRRLAAGLDESPHGYELDLHTTARAMGLSYNPARSSPFSKALQRCVMFGLAHPVDHGLAVRRRIPPVTLRHLQRMPEPLQAAHHEWQRATVSIDELSRAHRLATTMLDLGDDSAVIEHHLVALGVPEAVAAEVADNAFRLSQAG